MLDKIIDGKKIASEIRHEIKQKVENFRCLYGYSPCLAVLLWSNDPASRLYVSNKIKACKETGIESKVFEFSDDNSVDEVLETINVLNLDKSIHGVLVQLPLCDPKNEMKVLQSVDPTKDVDGLHPINAGNLLLGNKSYLPCTPQGIMALLEKSQVPLQGKHAVVIGRSNIVGKPIALMLLQKDATVTICHSKTQELDKVTRSADILIVAVGKPNIIQADMVKSGATVIDVGINRIGKKVVGDVDFENVIKVAGKITPVPGGVGPLTIAMLLQNTLLAAENLQMENS